MPVHSVACSWRPGQQDFKVGTLPCPALPAWYATVRSHPAFYLSFQEVWRSSPLYLSPPPAPQKKCKDLSASSDPGEDTVGEGDRWAGLKLWLPVYYSLCKHSPHPVPRHPFASKGSPSGPRTLGRKAAQPGQCHQVSCAGWLPPSKCPGGLSAVLRLGHKLSGTDCLTRPPAPPG